MTLFSKLKTLKKLDEHNFIRVIDKKFQKIWIFKLKITK